MYCFNHHLLSVFLGLTLCQFSQLVHAQGSIAKDGARFTSPNTFVYAWCDFVKADPTQALVAKLLQLPKTDQELIGSIKASGVQRVWMVTSLNEITQGKFVTVLESTSQQQSAALLKNRFNGMTVTSDDRYLYFGTPDSIEAVKKVNGNASPNLLAAIKESDHPMGIVAAVPQDRSEFTTIWQLCTSLTPDKQRQAMIRGMENVSYFKMVGDLSRPQLTGVIHYENEKQTSNIATLANEYFASLSKSPSFRIAAAGLNAEIKLSQAGQINEVFAVLGRDDAQLGMNINSMKQIILAIHNFADVYKKLPPQALAAIDGKKLLSWRVLLLPYLEQSELYDQFHLDEAWDSEHNKKLISKMPALYKNASVDLEDGRTGFVAPLTSTSVFGKVGGPLWFSDITDGTSNTIAVVLVAPEKSVIWTKPEDVAVASKSVFASLMGNTEDKIVIGMLDGSVRTITNQTTSETWTALLSINGGEVTEGKDIK